MKTRLRMDLMMFGKVKRTRIAIDKEGNRIITGHDKNGKPIYKREKYSVRLSRENGDQGIFPSVNAIFVRKGRSVTYTEAAQELYSLWRAQADMWRMENGWEPTNEKLYLDYYFYMPNDNRKRDTHNVLKMNIDAMKGAIFEDDDLVMPRIMDFQKCGDDEPHIEIEIWTKAEYDAHMAKLVAAYEQLRQ